MKYLDVRGNCIGDEWFVALSCCVSKIEMLLIGESNVDKVTMKGIEALCEGIQKRTEPVSILELDEVQPPNTVCRHVLQFFMLNSLDIKV